MVPQRQLTFDDYLNILRRRWLIITILAVAGTGLGVGAARLLPKKFTSETVVLVEQPTVSREYVMPIVSADTNQRLASMQQEILSRSRLEPIIRKLGLYPEDVQRLPMDDLVTRLGNAIDVTPVQPMARTNAPALPGFTISVTFQQPGLAQQICSTVTSMFLEENLRVRQHQAEQTTDFLTSQLETAKTKLDEQDAKLAAFQRAHMGSLPEDQEANLNMLSGLAAELDAATQALARAQQNKNFAESTLAEQLAVWKSTLTTANPEAPQQQIAAMEAQLTALRSKYTEDHPDVIRLKRNLETAKKNAQAAEKQAEDAEAVAVIEPPQFKTLREHVHEYDTEMRERAAQQEEIRARIKRYQSRVEETPGIAQEYKGLTRDYQSALEFYNTLLKNRDQAAMATDLERKQQSEQFRVLDPPSFPDRPSFPKLLNFLGGGFAGGLGVGLGIVVLLEMRDTSVRNDKDVEALLHLPVLAVVPMLTKPTGNNRKANLPVELAARG